MEFPRVLEQARSSITHSTGAIFAALCVLSLIFISYRVLSSGGGENPVRYEVEIPAQLRLNYKWDFPNSTGESGEVRDGKIYPTCPADGRSLGDPIIPATPGDIDNAIQNATLAQKKWSKTSFAERRWVLKSLQKYVLDHQEEIVTACCLDSGKTKIDACFGEILVTAEKLEWTIKHGERALRPSRRPTNLLMSYKKNVVVYEPLGVVAACVSWNYPFHNFISPVIAALFSGNAIVVKPSEQTCWSTRYFTALIRGALESCGHSGELVQNVICLPDVADHLTSHEGIRHITFIGSREVAHKVCTSAASSQPAPTPVTVELGGKDPAIVLDDVRTVADMDNVASILMRGVFQSAGQNCIGIERVIAMPGAHDRLLATILPQIQSLRLGSVLLDVDEEIDMGSMISPRSFDKLESLIHAAVAQGARLHCGGRRYRHPRHPQGHYFQPTLLSDVTAEMAIAQTELFAPVFLLMRPPTSVSAAVAVANSTLFGLGASVFGHASADVRHCVHALHCGMVAVNDFGAYYAVGMPFGGGGPAKGSGYGRFGGLEGLQGLCNLKSICEDDWWARILGVQTRLPAPLRYPVDPARGWELCMGMVEMGYGLGLAAKVVGLWGMLRAMLSQKKEGARGKTKENGVAKVEVKK